MIFRVVSSRSPLPRLCCRRALSAQQKGFIDVQHYTGLDHVFSTENILSKVTPIDAIPEPEYLIGYPSYGFQTLLDTIQTTSGLPWWAVFCGAGVVLRLSLLPVHVQFERHLMKRVPLAVLEKDTLLTKLAGDIASFIKKKGKMEEFQKEHGLRSQAWAIPYALPGLAVFALSYTTIGALASAGYLPVYSTPFLWVPSLSVADPQRILSFSNSLLLMAVARYWLGSSYSPNYKMLSSKKTWTLLFFSSLAAQATIPSALLLYWTTSNLTHLAVTRPLLMWSDPFRRAVGLPTVAERAELLAPLARTSTDTRVVQIGHLPSTELTPSERRERELEEMFTEGDLRAMSEGIREQRERERQEIEELREEQEFCREQEKRAGTDRTLAAQLRVQVGVLEGKVAGVEERIRGLDRMEKKGELAGSEVSLEEVEAHRVELLAELETCEKELFEGTHEGLDYFEKYALKQELTKLQGSLLADIAFCDSVLEKRAAGESEVDDEKS